MSITLSDEEAEGVRKAGDVTEFYTWMGQDPHEMTKEALIGALGILGRVHLGQLEQAADMTKMWAAMARGRDT
jgi:hypothetical protein